MQENYRNHLASQKTLNFNEYAVLQGMKNKCIKTNISIFVVINISV